MCRFEVEPVQDMSRSEVVQDMCRFDRVHCSQAKGKENRIKYMKNSWKL